MTSKAKVFLIPVPIDEDAINTLPPATLHILYQIQYFIVERSKTARHYLKLLGHPMPQSDINIVEIPKHGTLEYNVIKCWLDEGHPIGILSESGCPGIADPGAEIVNWAHKNGYFVEPLVGPSSILLALMASGFWAKASSFMDIFPIKKMNWQKNSKYWKLMLPNTIKLKYLLKHLTATSNYLKPLFIRYKTQPDFPFKVG